MPSLKERVLVRRGTQEALGSSPKTVGTPSRLAHNVEQTHGVRTIDYVGKKILLELALEPLLIPAPAPFPRRVQTE